MEQVTRALSSTEGGGQPSWKASLRPHPACCFFLGCLPHALHLVTFHLCYCLGEGSGTPIQYSRLESPKDGGAWWAAVHGVAKSWTRPSNFIFTLHFLPSCIGEGNGNPLQCSCLENPRDGGNWWAAVYGVEQNWTRLKQLSSNSSIPETNATL